MFPFVLLCRLLWYTEENHAISGVEAAADVFMNCAQWIQQHLSMEVLTRVWGQLRRQRLNSKMLRKTVSLTIDILLYGKYWTGPASISRQKLFFPSMQLSCWSLKTLVLCCCSLYDASSFEGTCCKHHTSLLKFNSRWLLRTVLQISATTFVWTLFKAKADCTEFYWGCFVRMQFMMGK